MTSEPVAGCTRCSAPVARVAGDLWSCPEHGEVAPLWRPEAASYDALTTHLEHAGGFPTYLPWPLGPGWTVTDFAVAASRPGSARATLTCLTGSSALDGPVDVIVISEEPGTGLGARVAGLDHDDPGGEVGHGTSLVKVRLGTHPVGLWPVSVSGTHGELDRSVLAGEAEGRWLWLVLRPASAILLLRDDWILRDVSVTGPQLVTLPFGGPAPQW
ncbi:MAG TPA: DUF6758 family protein [Nocardioides sp.]|nr:DUF6758 family protein [Nocardioides sp.]